MNAGPPSLVHHFRWLAAFTVVALGSPGAPGQEMLVSLGDMWRFFRGIQEPEPGWNTLEFDDRPWEEGASPFGYETGGDATALTMLSTGTVLTDMQNSYTAVYIRTEFTIADLSRAQLVQLGIQFDDAYVAYVNGVEVARTASLGTPGVPVPYDMQGVPSNERAALVWIALPQEAMDALQEGVNVLALEGLNTTIGSSDMMLAPQLRSFSTVCPVNATCTESQATVIIRWQNPTGALYDSVEIFRNGELIGEPSTPRSLIFRDRSPLPGLNTYEVVATYNGEACRGDDVTSCSITIEGALPSFRRGDADGDGTMLLTDAVFVLNSLFRGGRQPDCRDAADADDDGQVLLTDGVYILNRLFRGGTPPPDPGESSCGTDPTDDALGDCVYTSC